MVARLSAGMWETHGALASVQAWATDETNSFATNGTDNFVAVGGPAAFAENRTDAAFVFNPTTCLYTYTGPTLLLSARLVAVVENPIAGDFFGSLAVAVNGDLIGTTSNTNTTDKGQMQVAVLAAQNSIMITTERMFALATGETVQPCYGAVGGGGPLGANSGIFRMLFTIEQQGTP